MAGAEGRMKLALKHTAMSEAEKAAVTSEVFSSKRKAQKGGAKRKAEKDGAKKSAVKGGASKREKGGASKGKEVKGTTKRKVEKGTAADDLEVAAVVEDAAAQAEAVEEEEDTSGDEWVPGGTMRLPKEYVDWILARKRMVLEEDPDEYYNRMINDPDRDESFYTEEYLEEERELMRNMAAQYQRNGDRFEKFQDWVRLQLKEKGYVEVGEAYLAQRAMLRQVVTQEQWNVMFRDLKLDDHEKQMIHNARGAAVKTN